jgi:hypothetical protein
MPARPSQDRILKIKRLKDDVKVLTYLMDRSNLRNRATGRLESPQKLVIFYAGYIAMRRLWETKTEHGKISTGDPELDADKNDPNSLIYRIDKEIAHPLGFPTSTLLRVNKFMYWGRKIIKACVI